MLVRKEVIRPATYFYIDGNTQLPRKLDATKEFVKYLYESGKAMLAAGLSIPVPLEHQPTAKPLTAAERASKAADLLLHNAGWVNRYEMDGDILFSVLDIQDPEIAKKLPRTIRWTSPWINSFMDGNGKFWQGVISHLALTSTPRITQQSPFPTVSAAMSLAGALPTTYSLGATPPRDLSVCLSRAGLLSHDGAALKPVYPVAFSLYTGVALALEDLVKEEKKPAKPDTKVEPKPDAPAEDANVKPSSLDPAMPADPMMQAEEQLVDGDGDISVYTVLCDLLHTVGIELEEGTTRDNFAQRLYKAAMEKVKGMGGEPAMPDAKLNETPPAKPPASPIQQETPPMYMSIEQINAIADPMTKMLAMQLHESRQQIASLTTNTLETAKSARMLRIERLSKRLKPDVKDKLLGMIAAPSAQFSLQSDGKVNDPMDTFLGLLEDTAIDLPSLLANGVSLSVEEQPHPKDYSGELDDARAEKIADELCRASGIPEKKKAS